MNTGLIIKLFNFKSVRLNYLEIILAKQITFVRTVPQMLILCFLKYLFQFSSMFYVGVGGISSCKECKRGFIISGSG